MTFSASHAGLSGYLLRNRIEPGEERYDGALALVFDGNVRVLLHPALRGELVAEAQLCLLSDRAMADEDLMVRGLQFAATRGPHEATRLALVAQQERLVLQTNIAADASADQFETALARFLDAVNAWRSQFGTL